MQGPYFEGNPGRTGNGTFTQTDLLIPGLTPYGAHGGDIDEDGDLCHLFPDADICNPEPDAGPEPEVVEAPDVVEDVGEASDAPLSDAAPSDAVTADVAAGDDAVAGDAVSGAIEGFGLLLSRGETRRSKLQVTGTI